MKNKACIDLSYPEKDKQDYENFIERLESEGWTLESTHISQNKGRGKWNYRTLLRQIIQ